jgi:16S rRNA (guanine527-N7)-methyltransferase
MGSGAGFPGLVIAALRPDVEVTLVESDARKASFLAEAARRMDLSKPPKILSNRVEAVAPLKPDIITARALAPLGLLLKWADLHRVDTTICLFHKGKGWQAELTEAMKDWDIPYQSFQSVTDRDAVILRTGNYSRAGVPLAGARARGAPTAASLNDPGDRQPKRRRRQDNDRD